MSKSSIEGLDQWNSWVDASTNKIIEDVNKQVNKSGSNIQKGARYKSPVDSGDLRKSITKDFKNSNTSPESEIYTESEYGDHVESGTFKQRAQPYLSPSLDEEVPEFEKNLNNIMRKGFD